MKRLVLVFVYVIIFSAQANALNQHTFDNKSDNQDFTVLDRKDYLRTVSEARSTIETLLGALKPFRQQHHDKQVAFIAEQLADRPYLPLGGMGEGDWPPASPSYKPDSLHIQQNPVYRLDAFDCQSFVQIVMGLLYSENLNDFDRNILKIAYGAAGNPQGEIVRYYNRNNFIDGDFNPINERNGWLLDVTSQGALSASSAVTQATITRQNWFIVQQKKLAENVRVLKKIDGPSMVKRFLKVYANLNFPRFNAEKVTLSYVPKTLLALKQPSGNYQPNQALINKIPTPAIVEIVADAKKWDINGVNIKEAIGSELNVSHLGLVYRQSFKRGDFIYHKIICGLSSRQEKACIVTPIVCQKRKCNELMFVHATNAYPSHFYWYQRNGNFVCSPNPPINAPAKPCNRVERIPLFYYLTDYQYGSYWHMSNPAILGIHVEKLV